MREVINLVLAEKIRIVLVKRGNMSEADLARLLQTSPQNFNKKMRRDNFSEEDMVEIAKALNCTFEAGLRMNDTGELI